MADGKPITRETPGFQNAMIISKEELMEKLKEDPEELIDKQSIIRNCKLFLRACSGKMSADEISSVKEIIHLAQNNFSLKEICLRFFDKAENAELKKQALQSSTLPTSLKDELAVFRP